jgi:uncharacterized ferritin-like protein (DUF455 family)
VRARLDTAQELTRFHYLARATALAAAAQLPHTPRLEEKAELARVAWEQTLAADAFRERVFELRYPVRVLEEWGAADVEPPPAPGDLAALYRDFLAATDDLDDGPTERIVRQALVDVERERLSTASRQSRVAPDVAPLDDRYAHHRFYWPDTIVPGYPYGEGMALRVRSAVSHLNEVWAVNTAAAIMWSLAPELGWEWIREAGRWTYDEARHMLMGKRRLERWGLQPGDTPLGGYIYDACAGQDPLYRLGMLGYFETKNIGRKKERARAFHELGDRQSEVDMEFDWADETLHAEYGRRWLKELLRLRGEEPDAWPQVLERCEQLVEAELATATDADRDAIVACAERLLERADEVSAPA